MTTFLIITSIVILIFIVLNFTKVKPKEITKEKPQKTITPTANDTQLNELKGLLDLLAQTNDEGTDLDTIPDGYGEFGLEVTNPIPVNTLLGNMAYLGSLRTLAGEKVQYERVGSTGTPNIEKPIDMYEIFVNGNQITTLYISPYNKKNSERAPKGFKLVALP
jgi:hypothetical protein